MKLKINISFFLLTLSISAQYFNTPNNKLIEYKVSDIFEKHYYFNSFNSSRYLKIITTDPTERFESPSNNYYIDGIPFDIFPLNLYSVDLIPIDNLQLEKVDLDNGINFKRKSIPDSFNVSFRGYVGSETGDPLIHTYTKNKNINIDRIPPSGTFTISNGAKHFLFRFLGGYYGFHSTDIRNNNIITKIDPYYSTKQNKQIFLSGETIFDFADNRRILLSGSMLSFYGWEITPFIGSFVHLENYLYTGQVAFENMIDRFSFVGKYDFNITQIHGNSNSTIYKFSQNKIMLIPKYDFELNKNLTFSFSSIFSLNGCKNIRLNDYNPYLYFIKDIESEVTYNFSANAFYNPSEKIVIEFLLKYDKNIFNKKGVSSKIAFTYDIDHSNQIKLICSTMLKFPDISELNSNYTYFRGFEEPSQLDIFGNSDLLPERKNKLQLSYIYKKNNIDFTGTLITAFVTRPIYQEIRRISRMDSETDIIRDAIYENGEDGKLFGINLTTKYFFNNSISLDANYQLNDNSDFLFTPKHKLYAGINFCFSFRGLLNIAYQFSSKEIWESYKVKPINDYFTGNGFDGEIGMKNIFNIYYQQEIFNFLFFKKLIAKLSIENIFDNENINVPIGNSIGRAVIFGFEGNF
ncbi:MAG: hypothetical protein JXA68_10350 [Ignavibacteriales bacterium]|nr:hypothetical protein [Ignavibacteriales bacterium]